MGKASPVATFNTDLWAKAFATGEGTGAIQFRWSRAVSCPCLIEDTRQPDPTCPACGGDGMRYIHPDSQGLGRSCPGVHYMEIPVVFANMGLDPKWFTYGFGEWVMGDAMMTVEPERRVGYRDRFVGVNQLMTWQETLIRATAEDYVAVGQVGRTTAAKLRAMRYAAHTINYVGDRDTEYFPGTDYELAEETATEPPRLRWLTGQGPADGARYVVHYVCRPVWLVDSATYSVQHALGPAKGLSGKPVVQSHPTTFRARLDYLTRAEGT